jgi:hypothetical protein
MKPLFLDSPEPWESPYTTPQGAFFYQGLYTAHPFIPRSESEIPQGAFEPIAEACGLQSISEVFVIPSAVRLIGLMGRRVITPVQVLGMGPRGVALWAETPQPGTVGTIRTDELSYVEDVEILLYGRLSFYSAGTRLTIRYNTVARRWMEPALLALRRKMAPGSHSVPREEASDAELPFKWRYILGSPFLAQGERPSRTFRYSVSRRKKAGLLVLTDKELVYVRDSTFLMDPYGIDRFFFPRSRISSFRADQKALMLDCAGSRASIPMEPPLLDAARRWLS